MSSAIGKMLNTAIVSILGAGIFGSKASNGVSSSQYSQVDISKGYIFNPYGEIIGYTGGASYVDRSSSAYTAPVVPMRVVSSGGSGSQPSQGNLILLYNPKGNSYGEVIGYTAQAKPTKDLGTVLAETANMIAVSIWSNNIVSGKGTNDDYWNALNPRLDLSMFSKDNFNSLQVVKAIMIAHFAYRFTFYDQGDYREMYSNHCDTTQTIASSGCGPTAMASIVSTLTGIPVSPVTIAQYCVDKGFRSYDEGTYSTFVASVADFYGLNYRDITASQIAGSFDGSSLVIASVKSGMLTSSGHYISIAGVQDRNDVPYYIVYDPAYSANKDMGRFTNVDAIIDGGGGRLIIKQEALDKEIRSSAVVSR